MISIHQSPRRGVSLVEALVALAVMAFGMLSLVGVQATMRMNNDLAKQRTEATRIATEEIERLRGFVKLGKDQVSADGKVIAGMAWDDIAKRTVDAYAPPDSIGNSTYKITRVVVESGENQSPRKIISVKVEWTDRTGSAQTVTLDSVIAAVDPVLAGLLTAPTPGSAANQLNGRHVTIPSGAVDQLDGTSKFAPPGSTNVYWIFNNLTGVITSRCSASDCVEIKGLLLAGSIWFDLRSSPSSEAPAGYAMALNASQPMKFQAYIIKNSGPDYGTRYDAAKKIGPTTDAAFNQLKQSSDPECYANGPTTPDSSRVSIPYFCLVYPSDILVGYGGKFILQLAGQYPDGSALPGGKNVDDFTVCRYTTATKDFTENSNHPMVYCVEKKANTTNAAPCAGQTVKTNLVNQNFLVTASGSCPDSTGNTDLVNYKTLYHQGK
jgi:hypothetical protein